MKGLLKALVKWLLQILLKEVDEMDMEKMKGMTDEEKYAYLKKKDKKK